MWVAFLGYLNVLNNIIVKILGYIALSYEGFIRLCEEDPHKIVIIGFLAVAVCVLTALYILLTRHTHNYENNTRKREGALPYTRPLKQTDCGHYSGVKPSDDKQIKIV